MATSTESISGQEILATKLYIIPPQAEATGEDTAPVCVADEEERQQDVHDVIDEEESKLRAMGERIVAAQNTLRNVKKRMRRREKTSARDYQHEVEEANGTIQAITKKHTLLMSRYEKAQGMLLYYKDGTTSMTANSSTEQMSTGRIRRKMQR